ncbi:MULTISPECIES: winged helix-turn-helix domain-containing protein [unclassified Streptomyces]|uniref:winged helix-turn-helix domain-containing protein n=1 Tax=unclassified Streptomyces TaxID=2593676 RepID=UPI0033DB67BF
MTLRIHFTVEDLARTRVVAAPRPLLEVGLALWMLGQPECVRRLDAWQRATFRRLAAPVKQLAGRRPGAGKAPDFVLTPTLGDSTAEALRIVAATPVEQVQTQIRRLAAHYEQAPAWLRSLGDDHEALRAYNELLHEIHEHVVAPHWHTIDKVTAAARTRHTQLLAHNGVETMFNTLAPGTIRWNPPVLSIVAPADHDVTLGGRGLLLIPTLLAGDPFLGLDPYNVSDAQAQRWLSFSIGRAALPPLSTPPTVRSAPAQSLSRLLGRTRAMVLAAIGDRPGCNTTQLARRLEISTASASEHATALRAAGLTTAARHRNTMLHTLTSTGRAILDTAT